MDIRLDVHGFAAHGFETPVLDRRCWRCPSERGAHADEARQAICRKAGARDALPRRLAHGGHARRSD